MHALPLVLLVAACGRVGFDPPRGEPSVDDAAPDGRNDGAPSDAPSDAPGIDSAPAGPGETCATPILLTLGVALTMQSIAEATDDLPGGCDNGVEVVFAFEQPQAASRTVMIEAQFAGRLWRGAPCPPQGTSTCTGFSANGMSSGTVSAGAGINYIIVDKVGGAGTTFDIRVD